LVVAAGLVDIHSHLDGLLPNLDRDLIQAPLLLQGIATAVTGNCGTSPAPLTDAPLPLRRQNRRVANLVGFQCRTMGEFLDLPDFASQPAVDWQ